MTFDPTFRFYRADPQHREFDTLDEMRDELDAELHRRRELYPWMIRKGRMTEKQTSHELRVWRALRDTLASRPDRTGAIATWTEQIHALRREVALRRTNYPKWVSEGRFDDATGTRKLELLEGLHAMMWRYTWHDEAIAARAATEQRAAA